MESAGSGAGPAVRRLAERVSRRFSPRPEDVPDRDAAAEREAAAIRREELDARFHSQDRDRLEVIHALEAVRDRVDMLERRVQPVVASTQALPFMEGDPFETFAAGSAGKVMGFRENVSDRADRYVAFEDVFRGSESRVRAMLEPYLEIIGDGAPVADLGCGRGELLDLLRDAEISAIGVDADAGMVARSQAKGHEVEHADAVTYLERADDQSLGVVFSSHVIEHLPYESLERMLGAALRALRPGGMFIAETVNPHAVDALKGFWLDPTHEHPLFPEVMLVLCRSAGFGSGYVFHPGASGDVESDRFTAASYAVVATRG